MTKQELLAEIWPGSFVEENNLDKCIHAIRQVLGEKPGEQRYIETVRKHGYRFVAVVNNIETTQEGVEGVLDSTFLDEWKARTAVAKPVISTSETESGTFVVKAKWPPEEKEEIVEEIETGDQTVTGEDLKSAPVARAKLWNRKRALIAAAILVTAVLVSGYFLDRARNTTDVGVRRRGTLNDEAYKLYLHGVYLFDKRTPQDSQKSIEMLDEAIRLDPNYALAWAARARVHQLRLNRNIHEDYQRSMYAISKALALDPNLSAAYTALCENRIYYEYDFAAAEHDCKHAVDLNPNSPAAREIYSRFLTTRARHDQSVAEMQTAVELEPTSVFMQRNLGIALFYARRFDEADVQLRRVVEMDRNYWSTYSWLYDICSLKADGAAAFEWMKTALARQDEDKAIVDSYTAAFHASGWKGVQQEQARRWDRKYDTYYTGAIYNAQIGDKDKAFELLERSYEDREWGMGYLLLEPRLDNLREDPRLADLVSRVENIGKH